jgi:hypothetical protein
MSVTGIVAEAVLAPAPAALTYPVREERTMLPFSVVVLVPAVPPIAIFVVELARPPVPRLIVLVEAAAVAPAWMLVVWLTVERPSVIAPVPTELPIRAIPVVWLVAIWVLVAPPAVMKSPPELT